MTGLNVLEKPTVGDPALGVAERVGRSPHLLGEYMPFVDDHLCIKSSFKERE